MERTRVLNNKVEVLALPFIHLSSLTWRISQPWFPQLPYGSSNMHFIGMLQGSYVIILAEHVGDTLPQFIPSEKQDYNRHDTPVCFILLECQQLYKMSH